MTFKALPDKIQWSKTDRMEAHCAPSIPSETDRVKFFFITSKQIERMNVRKEKLF